MRVITRTVFILSVVSLFADIASEILYPVVPVYLQHIGFSVVLIGLLEGVANFTSGLSKGYFGKLSDQKGVRLPFVKLGYFLSSISKPMLGMFVYPIWIFFARTIDRLGKGVRTAARDALLSQEATPQTKGRVFGFHRGMDTAGATIGPALALLFLSFYPGRYTTLFYLAFIPGMMSVAMVFLLKEKKQTPSTLGKGGFFSFFKYYQIATPRYKKLVAGLLLFALFNSSDIFLLVKTKQALLATHSPATSDKLTIAAYVFYNLVYALASYPLGSLADKLGFRNVFLSGLVLFAGVYAGFAFNPSIQVIFVLFLVYGVYAAATEGVAKAWITNNTQKENTATAIGFYTSCESICALTASVVAGAIWSGAGSFYTFIITASAALLVAVYFLLTFRNN
jgi:MFS family permease